MWEPVPLPFENESHPPLPTVDEIRSCPNLLWERMHKVVGVNDEIVVKFGGTVTVSEGQTLIYLERHAPHIPAPRLYAMYYDSDQLFLVMQRAPGEQLGRIWDSLTEPEKDDITAKLKRTFDDMRQVECPWPDTYVSIDGGGLPNVLFWRQKPGEHFLMGPFQGEDAFVQGMVDNFRSLTEYNKRPDYKVRFYEKYLGRVLRGHRPRLTHGDVQQKNIMAKKREDQGFEVTLVDWANAGWFPDFWEFFCASSPLVFAYWEEDWCWRAQQFLEVWPAEMAIMRMVDKDLGLGF